MGEANAKMRTEGWEDRFLNVLERHSKAPFVWGQSDCATLPMDVVEALTGSLPETWTRDYDSPTAALRKLREQGVDKFGEWLEREFEEVHPALAHRGDIGIAEYPGAVMGGGVVVIGANVLGKGEQGVVMLPRSAMTKAFKVGR